MTPVRWLLSASIAILSISPRAFITATSSTVSTDSCERLKTTVKYKQENAPRDISAVLRVVVEKINRELDGVVDVEIGWTGEDIHRAVGDHFVQATVTRLSDQEQDSDETVTQCFHVPFTITDTDECSLDNNHPMKHQCPSPSICVNTIGGYECICAPDENDDVTIPPLGDETYFASLPATSPWSTSISSSSCPSSPSTSSCCPLDSSSPTGITCRSSFLCPTDPCAKTNSHSCAPSSQCTRSQNPHTFPSYTCECPAGLLGSGKKCTAATHLTPKVMYDGITPTKETLAKMDQICGCQVPEIDPCAGFPACTKKNQICQISSTQEPFCACAPGYISLEPYGCVDETPPKLLLKCDPDETGMTKLRQGDQYRECAVEVLDSNAEEYMRSLKIAYSRPLPTTGCFEEMGEFSVSYTVATPWTTPPFVGVVRKVVIEDLDECALGLEDVKGLEERGCGKLVPKCDVDNGAVCVNTVGNYMCECPEGMEGDGFLKVYSPHKAPGYVNGSGCRDVGKPSIQILGANPKIFEVVKSGGLVGITTRGKEFVEDENERKKRYELDISKMIADTNGAELCASEFNTNPKPQDCLYAKDVMYNQTVDLSARVRIEDLIQVPAPQIDGYKPSKTEEVANSFWWKASYNVEDDAGNEAETQFRYIQVKELSKEQIIFKIEQEKEFAIQQIKATSRSKSSPSSKNEGIQSKSTPPCPSCPACPPCKNTQGSSTTCPNTPTPIAESAFTTLFSDVVSLVDTFLNSLKDVIPAAFYLVTIISTFAFFLIILYRFILQPKQEADRQQELYNSVTYHHQNKTNYPAETQYFSPSPAQHSTPQHPQYLADRSPPPPPSNSMMMSSPPIKMDMSVGDTNTIFSPPQSRRDQGIYNNMKPITPTRSSGRT